MITPNQLIDVITADITLLDSSDKSRLLKIALSDAIFKALNECSVTSKLTRSADAFFDANKLYVAILDIYQHILIDMLGTDYIVAEADTQFVVDQSGIFIALLSKLLHPARIATDVSDMVSVLPGKIWIDNIKQVYDAK